MASPFVLGTPNRADMGMADPLSAAIEQVQQLAEMIDALGQQQTELLEAYDAAVQTLSDLQGQG